MKTIKYLFAVLILSILSSCGDGKNKNSDDRRDEDDRFNSNVEKMHLADSSVIQTNDSIAIVPSNSSDSMSTVNPK